MQAQTHTTTGPLETMDLAATLLADLPTPCVLALHGELGSGKTCFVRGLARAMGIAQSVTSPTFTIVNEYAGTPALYHIDLYRMSPGADVWSTGLEEYLESDGVVAIEWPERAADDLPPHTIHITFEPQDDPEQRLIRIQP